MRHHSHLRDPDKSYMEEYSDASGDLPGGNEQSHRILGIRQFSTTITRQRTDQKLDEHRLNATLSAATVKRTGPIQRSPSDPRSTSAMIAHVTLRKHHLGGYYAKKNYQRNERGNYPMHEMDFALPVHLEMYTLNPSVSRNLLRS